MPWWSCLTSLQSLKSQASPPSFLLGHPPLLLSISCIFQKVSPYQSVTVHSSLPSIFSVTSWEVLEPLSSVLSHLHMCAAFANPGWVFRYHWHILSAHHELKLLQNTKRGQKGGKMRYKHDQSLPQAGCSLSRGCSHWLVLRVWRNAYIFIVSTNGV